jgi:predicted N-acetyltransferase YhbS
MAVVRMLKKDEMIEAVHLSDATFRDAEQPSMAGAFPFMFSDGALHISFGGFEDGKLVSFMGLVPWIIRIGEARLRVFSLGSVCTHPDARGKGIASEVLSEVYEYIRQAGASLLLVSGYRTLYTRTGCAPFGRTRRYSIHASSVEGILANEGSSSLQVIREIDPADIYGLHEIASSRSVRYEYGVSELASLIKAEALASCMKMKQRVLVEESEGKVTAFAVIGLPTDPERHGLVLEQAGDPKVIVRLAGHAVKRFGLKGLDIPVPWHETEMHARLINMKSSEEDHLGTIRIVDGGALVEQLRPWLDRKDSGLAGSMRMEQREDGKWLLEEGGNRLALTAKELVRLLFDCASAEEPKLEGADFLKGIFPVPFPYTAGLAYI